MSNDEGYDTAAVLRDFLGRLTDLPESDVVEILLEVMAVILAPLTRDQVVALRAHLVEKCGEEPEMLALIDGHLALRDLQKS